VVRENIQPTKTKRNATQASLDFITQAQNVSTRKQEKEMSPAVQATLEMLTPLVGVWKGRGRGGYPTIVGFDYAETFRVHHDPEAAFLTYEQNTELVDPEGRVIRKSHWEAGVLRPLEDGRIELVCVQGSGRVEVLRGHFLAEESLPEELSLRFKSELIGNDERVRSTVREWSLTGDHFKYVMEMATSEVGEPTLHLETNLFKV
jgi:hypothetical protein